MKIYMVNDNYQVTEHFTAAELACKGGGVLAFRPGFLQALEELRVAWGKPLKVNSCCRSPDHNKAIGGHERSLHLTVNEYHNTGGTCAIDFDTSGMSGYEKGELHTLAKSLGWSCGLGDTFLHCDRRVDLGLPQKDFFY